MKLVRENGWYKVTTPRGAGWYTHTLDDAMTLINIYRPPLFILERKMKKARERASLIVPSTTRAR